ncbi:hypothetical protein [Streptomyces sp. ODS28]|uniref:hypothetical protein n=1 Tax=Streptomyces sp. ODS28 TaxID=3136688 RepID=UPI0031F0F150
MRGPSSATAAVRMWAVAALVTAGVLLAAGGLATAAAPAPEHGGKGATVRIVDDGTGENGVVTVSR